MPDVSFPLCAAKFRRAVRRCAVIAHVACALALVAGPVAAQSDATVLAAKQAFDRGDRARLDALAPGAAGHPLAPYVTYWQLKLGIDVGDLRARNPNLIVARGSGAGPAGLRPTRAATTAPRSGPGAASA